MNQQDVCLKDISYYRTGGSTHVYFEPRSDAELIFAIEEIRRRSLPFFLLGKGSNSLVVDDPWPGAVISFRGFDHFQQDGKRITVGAGIENTQLAQFALDASLEGAAWMNALPGQLGGTVRMNARCYGGEISQIVKRVHCISLDGQKVIYDEPNKIFRGYKDTHFMESGDLIYQVEIELSPGDKGEIQSQMDHFRQDRESKGQFLYPSCGCVFKNDYSIGIPSGALLEACGLKGARIGGAEISQKHANFVYNISASSRDILQLTFLMREKVWEKFGVWLEYEMEILGKLPDDFEVRVREKKASRPNHEALDMLRHR
jgi:UDP-N-acetylmuramate dehydrogenase